MFGQCLVTPTLLDSYEFMMDAPASWSARAEQGFLVKLRREKVDYPAWVSKGQDFEDTVYRVCNAHYKDRFEDDPIKQGSELFQNVCMQCIGGTFQQKLTKKAEIAGEKVYFFGYSDVNFKALTLDLKTTLKYKGPQKYLKGHQHLIYSWIRQVPKFQYLIAQWENEESNAIQAVHTVDYEAPSMDVLEEKITAKVEEFFTYLKANDLWLDYYHTFSKN